MTAYYIATYDPRIADQWHLAAPRDAHGNEIRGYQFRLGRPYAGPQPVKVPIYRDGRPLEVSIGAEKMVVVSQQAMQVIEPLAAGECEFFAVTIPRMSLLWYILNACTLVECFDEARSRFTPGSGDERYSIVTRLMLDPDRIRGHQLFRVKGWDVDLIVSDTVKAAIEGIPNHGVLFRQVTP